MSNILLVARSVLGIGIIAAMLAGCGGSPSEFGAMPQNAPGFVGSDVQPNAACLVVGKVYTTGNGHAKIKFGDTQIPVPFHWVRVPVELHLSNWPESRPIPAWVTLLATCGPQSGKKPIGKILDRVSKAGVFCHNGVCNYRLFVDVFYEPPKTLPNGKAWKYDEILFRFKTHKKGWDRLPAVRIELVKS